MAPLTPTAGGIGRRIKAARTLAGLPAWQLAANCGWDVNKLYRFERGQQVPDAIELGTISNEVGQTVDWLLHGEATT